MLVVCLFFLLFLIILVYLGDVMGAKVVNQFVKSLFVLRAVDFGELFHCFEEFFVQPRSVGHPVAGTPDNKRQNSMKQVYKSLIFIIRARAVFGENFNPGPHLLTCSTHRTCCGL